jgi:hypothetical protein
MRTQTKTFWLASSQITLTVLLVSGLTLVTDRWIGPSPFNIIWMFGIPLSIAIFTSNSVKLGVIMAFVLLICSFFAIATTGAVFGLGP